MAQSQLQIVGRVEPPASILEIVFGWKAESTVFNEKLGKFGGPFVRDGLFAPTQ